MVICADIRDLQLDGVELIAGSEGLNRSVSWSYVVLTRPFEEHMNRGNFALMVVDFERYDFDEAIRAMVELDGLGISGLAVSVVEDSEPLPEQMKAKADELKLPLFYVRWRGASFVDIAQSIGNLITENNIRNKREGDYLYNLLFGYDINEKYIEKISKQFGVDFSKPYRVGIIVVDRKYGINLEQDEHYYEYYTNSLQYQVSKMQCHPMFMAFLNKFVLLFEAKPDKSAEHELEKILKTIDANPQFGNTIKSTCILGAAYSDPRNFSQSYQEAKSLIGRKDLLPNPKNKKVLSASSMGLYKYLFNSGNSADILKYCNERLSKLEEYDHANGTFLQETLVEYFMNGFSNVKTAQALFIHRNSLQNRLDKIEELLGFELNDYTEYLDLINCILVKRLMFM
ncbi:MAG: helix-turn-helix domain-containing protein [Lachnospiraceae bacterium]|nr:helix-turn-helix domain-containing protein [Lachnospiraceae bacterium]